MGSAIVTAVQSPIYYDEIKYKCPRKSTACDHEHRLGYSYVGNRCFQKLREISDEDCCRMFKARFHGEKEIFLFKEFKLSTRGSQQCKREVDTLRILATTNVESAYIIMPLFTIELRSIGLEYCAEGDLASLLSRRSLYRHEIRKFASEIAYGLSFLHFHRILHEDLKPSNIGLTADFHVRISNFGCSEILLDPFEDSSGQDRFSWDIGESMSGGYKVLSKQGTLQYSSPEKVLMIPHSFEADWWSYGVVIYEMATGIVPWYAPEASELRRMICENPLTVPEGLRPELDGDTFRFVEDLIGSKDPRQRLGYRGDTAEFKSHSFLIKVPEPKL